jgi:hypothetical protein
MTHTASFYVNDLWTINDNHSVMAGLRFDNYKLTDSKETLHCYSQPTLRLEYKWDIAGDQKRLVNVSWGQFHTELPAGLYKNMVAAPDNNTQTMYWNTGTATPYLVDKETLMDLNNYGLRGAYSVVATPNLWTVGSDFKQPISTEIAVGYRRNLENGGSLKATYAYRSWQNDAYGWTASESGIFIFEANNTKLVRRVLANLDGFERYYHGIELEWDLPIHKRVTFGGNWTWRRLLSNDPSIVESPTDEGRHAIPVNDYWDDMTGSRTLWAPLRPQQAEHQVNWYFLFDLSSGRFRQSLTFRGSFGSAGWRTAGYTMNYGYPVDHPNYLWLQQFINAQSGASVVPGSSIASNPSNATAIYTLTDGTGSDGWSTSLRYLLTIPLVRKVSLLTTIDIGNPFNHRGKSGWSPAGFNGVAAVMPYVLRTPTGTTGPQYPFGGSGNDVGAYATFASGDHNGLYTGYMGGRSVYLQTGLRF